MTSIEIEEEYLANAVVKLKLMKKYNISDLNFHQRLVTLVSIIIQENPNLTIEQPSFYDLAVSKDEENALILAQMLLNHDNQK